MFIPGGAFTAALVGGAVGGVTSVAAGGDFGSGFLSAGFAELAGPMVSGWGDVGGLVGRSVVGGTAGVLGGGRFENGAVTAAFGYLFNECVHPGGGCSLLELDPPIESVCPECGLIGGGFFGGIKAVGSGIRGVFAVKGAGKLTGDAAKLSKQLGSQEGVGELLSGGGRAIAGAGTNVPLRDVGRLVKGYGGSGSDWAKITSTAPGHLQTHAYRNMLTGEVVELKSIVP